MLPPPPPPLVVLGCLSATVSPTCFTKIHYSSVLVLKFTETQHYVAVRLLISKYIYIYIKRYVLQNT